MHAATKIHVTDGINPVPNALVFIYTGDGKQRITYSQTSEEGDAEFQLPTSCDGIKYQVRVYKSQYSFQLPSYLLLKPEDDGTSISIIRASKMDLPLSTDARFCRLTGFFRSINGAKAVGLNMMFTPDFNPTVVEGAGIIKDTVYIKTDQSGYATVDLLRGAVYNCSLDGVEASRQKVYVPDALSGNLVDVLFPYVTALVFGAEMPIRVPKNTTVRVPVSCIVSNYRQVQPASDYITWQDSNPENVGSYIENNQDGDFLVLSGKEVGTNTITLFRRNVDYVRIPDSGIYNGTIVTECY